MHTDAQMGPATCKFETLIQTKQCSTISWLFGLLSSQIQLGTRTHTHMQSHAAAHSNSSGTRIRLNVTLTHSAETRVPPPTPPHRHTHTHTPVHTHLCTSTHTSCAAGRLPLRPVSLWGIHYWKLIYCLFMWPFCLGCLRLRCYSSPPSTVPFRPLAHFLASLSFFRALPQFLLSPCAWAPGDRSMAFFLHRPLWSGRSPGGSGGSAVACVRNVLCRGGRAPLRTPADAVPEPCPMLGWSIGNRVKCSPRERVRERENRGELR